jgi:predicted aldo/keto reductase-like oxidoreductase
MNYAREVVENVATAEMKQRMTDAELRQLVKAIGKLGKQFRYGQVCLRCEYCQPCPQGIRIPEVLKAHSIVLNYQTELRYVGLDIYKSLLVKPDVCKECGECVKKCPAGLPIPERLKEARKAIEALMAG